MKQVNSVLMNQLKADYLAIKGQGAGRLACQGMLVPRGMEDMRFLIKGSMRPIVSNGDPAEVQYAGGFTGIIAGIPNTKYEGTLQLVVTEAGHDQLFAEYIVANRGMIDCDYYDGRMDGFTRSYELLNCALRFEQAEMDTESRSNVMTISVPCTYNYFGSFAEIGSNNTAKIGQMGIDGASDMVNRVQGVLNTAQQAINLANQVQGVGSSIGRTLGSLFG